MYPAEKQTDMVANTDIQKDTIPELIYRNGQIPHQYYNKEIPYQRLIQVVLRPDALTTLLQ